MLSHLKNLLIKKRKGEMVIFTVNFAHLIVAFYLQCTARKPDWETGASTALPRSSKLRAAAAPAPMPAAQQPPKRAVWSLAADEEEEELLDDEELLTEEDLKRPEVPGESIFPSLMHF